MKQIVLALLCLCAACAPSEHASPLPRGEIGDRTPAPAEAGLRERRALAIPEGAPLVAFLGDSISAGLHLSAERAFPAVLQADLAGSGLPFRLLNAGVSGDTSAGGLARIDWVLERQPAVVVIELGGNDGLRGQDLAAVEANLRAIVARVRASGARPLLLGMRIPPSYGADYAAGFAAIYERIAGEMQVPLVQYFMEGVGGVPDLLLPDGLHPTARGHEILADNVAPKLRQVLEGLTR